MKKGKRFNTLVVGITAAAVVAVAIPFAAWTMGRAAAVPTLAFEGMEFNVTDNGIQALMTVSVEHIDRSQGASYLIEYNSTYLTPSDYLTNAELPAGTGMSSNADFFRVDPDLYSGTLEAGPGPFREMDDRNAYFSQVDTASHLIRMRLYLEQDKLETGWTGDKNADRATVGKIVRDTTLAEDSTPYFYMDSSSGGVALGRLSFWVDPGQLQTMVTKFADPDNPPADGDYLLKLSTTDEPYAMKYFDDDGMQWEYKRGDSSKVDFRYQFPATLVKAEAAEKTVTINAWQAYGDGSLGDVAKALQTYSPMVTATYADGSVKNFLMEWDKADTDAQANGYGVYRYDETAADHKGEAVASAGYDPTGGDYLVEQLFYYEGTDLNGDPVLRKLPTPIRVRLTVTPVTVVGVTADRLEETYILDSTFAYKYAAMNDLHLPETARLITDVNPGGVTLTLPIPGWSPDAGSDLTTLVDTSGGKHWPAPNADYGSGNIANIVSASAGDYQFALSKGDPSAPDDARYTKADIQGAYPWLSVATPLDPLTARRTLAGESTTTNANRYQATYQRTDSRADGTPTLVLQVTERDAGGNAVDMEADTQFRIRLPGGTEMVTTGTDSWFNGGAGESYTAIRETLGVNSKYGFTVSTNPGSVGATDAHAGERELLRRSINLGGWFQVAVNEKPDNPDYLWSDFIPVYVPPRENDYTESKEYNFTGINAGLFQYAVPLKATLSVPRGEYVPLQADGTLAENPVRYGVSTTYDGLTGAQPGLLHTFTVKPDAVDPVWPAVPNTAVMPNVTTYGPNQFLDGAVYGDYGAVKNPDAHTAMFKAESADTSADLEQIRLTYEGVPTTSVSEDASGQVTLVVYDTKQEDYTYRQEYVLTITNTGTVPINGLYIDTITDRDNTGGHYEVIKPPASYLPAGASTTFTLTYVYDLPAVAKTDPYLDTIFICSDRHGPGAGNALRQFDARFRVTDSVVSRVTVVTEPADGTMGTAGLIEGAQYDGAQTPPRWMDYTPHAATYESRDAVYVSANLVDEYEVEEVYYLDSLGQKVPLTRYETGNGTTAAAVSDGTDVYYLPDGDGGMPGYNITIHVVFYESIQSKLRLSDLKVYGEQDDAALTDTVNPPAPRTLWQKAFTDAELGRDDMARMQLGRAGTAGFASSNMHYLVVLPTAAERAQVEVTLREVEYLLDGRNSVIDPEVTMTLYGPDGSQESVIYGPQKGNTNDILDGDGNVTTPGPSTHKSDIFDAPAAGASKYVVVNLSFTPDGGMQENRSYYVELVRRPEAVVQTTLYGNSPYGMIMNASNIAEDDKQAAKDAFAAARRFVEAKYTPTAAAGLTNTYHKEAWAQAGTAYEPESGTDLSAYPAPWGDLDLNDHALFILIGQGFTDPGLTGVKDNSMRAVAPADIRRSVEVTLLDTGAAAAARFAQPADGDTARTVKLDLGAMDTPNLSDGDWRGVPEDPAGEAYAVRPGVYTLVYEFTDYDGVTPVQITRPLVILGAVGDVDVSGTVVNGEGAAGSDERALEDRVTAPLGYAEDTYPYAQLFKHRTCDVNNDRNVNNIDANQLAEDLNGITQYYKPTGYQ